ncbi:MAG TPA: hypothetical protein PKA84_07420, partial [Rubrivivax sp.]|nr:hypothetical protein [Rubrivivax sp.]
MILINLLPHREARRAQRKRTFFAGLALSALARSARGAMILFAAVSLVTPVIGEKLDSNLDDGRFELIDLTAAPLRLAAHLLGVDPA